MTIAERLGRGKEARRAAELEKDAYIDATPLLAKTAASGTPKLPQAYLIVLMLALSSLASFGLGMLAGRGGKHASPDDSFWIEKLGAVQPAAATTTPETPTQTKSTSKPIVSKAPPAAPSDGSVIASKTGSTYYLPWCGAAKRIKDENKVSYPSRAAAEAAGYKPAKNCKGL